jgi:cytochrome c biogenesis protein CcdA
MNQNRGIAVYILFIMGVAALAIAGYTGYALYPRFNLPAVSGAGLLMLAAAAGIASFFSPCSFPLLATLLARETEVKKEHHAKAVLGFALALSAGATAFLILTGIGIAAGGGAIFKEVTFTSTTGRSIRLLTGALLVVLGLTQTGILSIPLFGRIKEASLPIQRLQARIRRVHPAAGFFLFGFGYILAGFG